MSRMIRWITIFSVVCILPTKLSADDNSTPNITVMQKGVEPLIQDLEFLVKKLTNEEEQKEWVALKDLLDSFKIGIEPNKPIRIDIIYGKGTEQYISYFPVAKSEFKNFRKENLDGYGITTRGRRGFYKTKGAYIGFMRYLVDFEYAVFAELAEQIPKNLPDPIPAIKPLVDLGFDVALHGWNENEGIDLRHETFQENRKELIAAIKKRENESDEDFKLRKMLLETQLDEIERFYAEIKDIVLGWKLDTTQEKPIGELELDFSAIEGSTLFSTIEQISKEPSYFAAVPKTENAILSLRISHPLDELRKANFIKVFENLRDRQKRIIDESADLSDTEKTASKEISDLAFSIMIENATQGILDGFAEAFTNKEKKNTIVGGSRCVDQAKVMEILNKLPEAQKGQTVELNVDSQGEIKIHKIVLNLEKHKNYADFVGEPNIFIATNDKAIWYSAGHNALEELKKVIELSGKEAPESEELPQFASLFMKIGPWLDLRQQRDPEKGDIPRRKMALEAFAQGADTINLKLWREKNNVKGHMVIEQGILSFVGKMIAEFSKENLDE